MAGAGACRRLAGVRALTMGNGGSGGGAAGDDGRGVEVTDISLNSSTPADIIAQISLRIPNPSLLQLAPLGSIALVVSYRHLPLGVFAAQSWDAV